MIPEQDPLETALSHPLRLTLLGMWAERLLRAFWVPATIVLITLSALIFGLQDALAIEVAWPLLVLSALAALAAALRGAWRFRRPLRAEALARIDARMPGQPLAALADHQAIGVTDEASVAVWAAHRARMAARAAGAKAVEPDLDLSRHDPYALRFVAATAIVVALLFGSVWRLTSVQGLVPGATVTATAGPSWEGWALPPPYTGKPSIYLPDVPEGRLTLPEGSRLQFRLYGDIGDLTLAETVSDRTEVPPASEPMQDFVLAQSGTITISGAGGREWQVVATPDAPPTVTPAADLRRESDGRLKHPFSAADDYGVTAGQVEITLDLAAIERAYGLTVAPEPRDPVTLDLPMPINGKRTAFSETLVDDLSQHPFANLPVVMTFSVTDAAGQVGKADPLHVTLPGRRFFDPVAAALVEMRRDLLWSRANARRVAQVLKAVTFQPEGFFPNERAYLRLRVLIRDLDTAAPGLTVAGRDAFAAELWDIALLLEDGDLSSALDRLRRAQDRLDQAIKNGADPAEIDKLMQEMQQALDDYMNQLAQQAKREPEGEGADQMQGMQMSADQLQQMLDKLQQLMREGKTAEAQELSEMLRQLMENMQVTQGQGQGDGPGQQSMRDLSDTLRDQQGLSDDAFKGLQQDQNGTPDQGQGQGQEQGENGQDPNALADRQRELADRLNRLQQGQLPGDGAEAGEAGRQALDEAGRAMDDAEQALRDGDLPRALDRQADAMESMREGMQNFGDALAEQQRQQNGEPAESQEFGQADPNAQRDPLGREPGNSARIGSDRNMLQGQDVYRRAQELLDEIRRRAGEQARPGAERDYLRRLLDLF